FKISAGGITMTNLWGRWDDVPDTDVNGFRMTEIGFDTLRYFYWDGGRAIMQIRPDSCMVEWAYIKNGTRYALSIIETDLNSNAATTSGILIQNMIIDSCASHPAATASIRFENQSGTPDDQLHGVTLRKIFINNSGHYGIALEDDGKEPYNMLFENCLIVNSDSCGLLIDPDAYDITVQNCIIVDSDGADIDNDATGTTTLRNTVYTSYTGSFTNLITNYDTDSGDPFVGSGDYRSAVGASTINGGTDVSRDSDIINNEISIQDIGAFEYGENKYNWTDR
ncbi:hypothetical protein LCGC14_1354140, partial [marine sediment metagenome]